MPKTRKTLGRKPKAAAKRAAPARKAPVQLSDPDRDLIRRLAERTSLTPREVVERALAGDAAAVAPGMPLHPEPPRKGKKGEPPPQALYLSVDGKREIEVDKGEFVLGSGAGALGPRAPPRRRTPAPGAAGRRAREGRHGRTGSGGAGALRADRLRVA